jgi:hypothetical protein
MQNLGYFSQVVNFVDLEQERLLYFCSMQNNSNSIVLSALLNALRPIARLLMKAGVGYREFAEISKCAFVDVSTTDYGLRGRPTNISRVAVMTGLTRKEVKRLRGKIAAGSEIDTSKVIPPTEIIHQWHSDSNYIDERGKPLVLPFDGDEISFGSLVKKYGGDIPPGAMRTELKRVNAIEEDSDGNLTVKRRHIRPVDKEQVIQTAIGRALFGLAHAINHNLDNVDQHGWLQRLASTTRIRVEDKPRVRRISRDRAEEFITSIDDLFSAYETIYPDESTEKGKSVVGVGVYYFESDLEGVEFFTHSKLDG